MSGDNEPLIPRRDEPLLPITNRRAPILSRLRERRNKQGNLGAQVASKVATLALFSTDDERIEEAEEIRDQFIETLSKELGVPRDAINPELANEFTAMFVSLEETDIVLEEVLEEEGEQETAEGEQESVEEEQDEEDGSIFG